MKEKKERGKHTEIPLLPPEDPIFSRGPIVAGRVIVGGLVPKDHWIYGQGALLIGRPTPPPKKKPPEKK